MKDIKVGQAVRSKAGHDRGRWFAVVELRDNFALIADGRSRSLSKPKLKKLMHLSAAGTVFEPQEMRTDKALRCAIARRFGGEGVGKGDS